MSINVREYLKRENYGSSLLREQRVHLLTQGWALLQNRDYQAVAKLLEPLPEEDYIAEPEIGYLYSAALRRIGSEQKALQLLDAIALLYGHDIHSRLFLECTSLTGATLLSLGRPTEAERCYQAVCESATEIGEEYFVAVAGISLGIIADIRGYHRKALAEFQRVIPWLYQSGLNREIAAVHHNLGMVNRNLELLDEALTHFEHARFNYDLYGSKDDLAQVDVERALTLCLMGDFQLAGATIDRVHDYAVRLKLQNLAGEALRVRGIVAFARGDRVSARAYLANSLETARTTTNLLLEAEVLEELAVLEQAEGNRTEAENLLAQAERVYHQLGSPARAQRAHDRIFPKGEKSRAVGPL